MRIKSWSTWAGNMFYRCSLLLVVTCLLETSAVADLPAEIARLYIAEADASVSDEFNEPALDTGKWDYRTGPASGNWRESNVAIIGEGTDRYLDLRGKWKRSAGDDGVITGTGTSSGVYSLKTAGRGFYTTRWRVQGIRPDKKSSWHPAIWCHRAIVTLNTPSRLPTKHIEIDLIEFSQSRTLNIQWHSQGVPWHVNKENRNVFSTVEARGYNSDFEEGVWQTHGMEYHADYLQLWQFDEASRHWSLSGARITLNDGPTNKKTSNINKDYAHQQAHWILSNYDFFDRVNRDAWQPYHGRPINADDDFLMNDSSLQIDYFRYHPLADDEPQR